MYGKKSLVPAFNHRKITQNTENIKPNNGTETKPRISKAKQAGNDGK